MRAVIVAACVVLAGGFAIAVLLGLYHLPGAGEMIQAFRNQGLEVGECRP